MENTSFQSRQVSVGNISTHLTIIGDTSKQAVLLLHGYPESAYSFRPVMDLLKDKYYLLAIDLPGIGQSQPIEKYDKLSIAGFIKDLIQTLQLTNLVLAGHDVGGMITYSFAKHYPDLISKAVILCTAIPGVEPWEVVKSNPHIWHFAFYAVPELPEQLIRGKHELLFEYFYNTISFNRSMITKESKEQYAKDYDSEQALKTSLGWYRAFPQDEKDNKAGSSVDIPVLYLRGEKDPGDINTYLSGLTKSGLPNITGESIPGSGHFGPEENPEYVANALDRYISNG